MQNKKGFTIIELIVVVAIIAVLAAIVSINVVTYLKKGKDAAIKSNLDTAQAAMVALVDSTAGIADGDCAVVSGDLYKAYAAATAIGVSDEACTDTTDAACACVELLVTPANYVCVDSTGTKKVDVAGNCATDCTDYLCDGD